MVLANPLNDNNRLIIYSQKIHFFLWDTPHANELVSQVEVSVPLIGDSFRLIINRFRFYFRPSAKWSFALLLIHHVLRQWTRNDHSR